MFTDFAHKSAGLPKDWGWVDIFGLDRELLNMVPEPCAGVILLFPCTEKIYQVRREQKEKLQRDPPSPATQSAYHVKQVAEFGNACGTIASVHALINGATVLNNQDPSKHSALQEFRDGNANASPSDRGRALLKTSALRSSSDQSASHRAAQTACRDRHGPDLDHHFVAFSPIPVDGGEDNEHIHVVELDGTKVKPVDHGSIASILEDHANDADDAEGTGEDEDPRKHSFLRAVARVIRKQYMEVEPDSIEFTMMALCKIK